MIIQLTGEQLTIEYETLLDDYFDVEIDDNYLELNNVEIVSVTHPDGGDYTREISSVFSANQAIWENLIELKDQAKLEREAQNKEIDL